MQMLAMVTGADQSPYVHLETRRALGREHFKLLLDAIKDRKLVSLTYHKFSDLEPEPRLVEPLALKESQNRWYLIAMREGNIRTYGLDRILELEVTPKPFKYPENWSVEEYFHNAFGVINNDDGPQEILLSFNWQQGNYVKAYPLHHSQKVVLEQDGEIQISLYMSLSFDFVQEILWHRQELEVLAPETLRQQVQTALKETLKYYVQATTNT
jgi:predicted DNA-binding transcriptional regulator YafY